MALTLNPYDQKPVDFAKVAGGLIAIFFALILTTALFSGLGRTHSARMCCFLSCLYFAASTTYIMFGMIVSFEVARSQFDRDN
jgi:hypothetical protein